MKVVGIIWAIGVTGAIALVVTLVSYFSIFDGGLSETHKAWSEFGDYVGGVLGAIFAFLSLIALLYTIWVQHKELQEHRDQMREANSLQRLHSLAALRAHYVEVQENQLKWAEKVADFEAEEIAEAIFWDTDELKKEVTAEIIKYHDVLVGKPKDLEQNNNNQG